jgi:hypothetical protein
MAVSLRCADENALIDEYGALYTESLRWAPKERRLEALKLIIRGWYPDLPADKTDLAIGTRYEIQVGERAVEKSWKSMRAVYKAVGGLKAFLAICTVTFKALSEAIGKAEAEALQQEAKTGNRKLVAVPYLAPAVELLKAA